MARESAVGVGFRISSVIFMVLLAALEVMPPVNESECKIIISVGCGCLGELSRTSLSRVMSIPRLLRTLMTPVILVSMAWRPVTELVKPLVSRSWVERRSSLLVSGSRRLGAEQGQGWSPTAKFHGENFPDVTVKQDAPEEGADSQGVEAKRYRRPPIPGHQEQADTGVLTDVNFILLASQPGGATRTHEQRHPWISENF